MLKTEYAINENITKTEITRLKLQQLYETMTRSPTTLWDYDTTANNSMRLWHDRQQLYETMTRPQLFIKYSDGDVVLNNQIIRRKT